MDTLTKRITRAAVTLAILGFLIAVTAAVTGATITTRARGAVIDPIYRVVVPVASDNGTGRLISNDVFQSEEACVAYMKDAKFTEMLKDIVTNLAVHHVRLTDLPRCDKFDPPGVQA